MPIRLKAETFLPCGAVWSGIQTVHHLSDSTHQPHQSHRRLKKRIGVTITEDVLVTNVAPDDVLDQKKWRAEGKHVAAAPSQERLETVT